MINFDNAGYVTKSQAMIQWPNFSGLRTPVIILAVQFLTSAVVAEVEIKTVNHQFLAADSFQRLSEFFTGKENRGRRLIVRTQEGARAGQYFILTLNQNVRALPKNARLKLEIITSESTQEKEFLLPLPSSIPRTREIFAGITGSDWPQNEIKILAWRLTVQDDQGKFIADKESFLWKSP